MEAYNYGDVSYWDKRYSEKVTTYDWLQSWKNLKGIIENEAMNDSEEKAILNMGCGNSVLCEEMYDEGY